MMFIRVRFNLKSNGKSDLAKWSLSAIAFLDINTENKNLPD